MGAPSLPRFFRFGAYQLDLRARELRRNGVKVRVPDQSVQVLAMLLEHPDKVVTREELASQTLAERHNRRVRPQHQRGDQATAPGVGGFRGGTSVCRNAAPNRLHVHLWGRAIADRKCGCSLRGTSGRPFLSPVRVEICLIRNCCPKIPGR
jgi:hypothetical protein